jgi:large subunit ribosomal protein L10
MRPEKQLIVEDLKKQVGASPFVILTEYKGMTVGQFAELRKRLRGAKAEYHVAKNTMLRHALKAADLPEVDRNFGGMTALVIGNEKADIGAVAKVLKQFGKEFEKPKFKAGSMGKQALSADEISAVADLPSLEALRAQLVGLLQTPATRIAVVLGAPAAQIARVLKAHADKQGAATPAAVGAAPA